MREPHEALKTALLSDLSGLTASLPLKGSRVVLPAALMSTVPTEYRFTSLTFWMMATRTRLPFTLKQG